MTTFGFEAEFDQNAAEVAAHLHRMNPTNLLIATPDLHRYHCECTACAVATDGMNRIYPFRAQTDSSCSGEVISKVFETMDEARPFMEALQEAAVEVDATPGYNAGFHVHVMIPREDPEFSRAARFYEFIRREPAFVWLARGRFEMLRQMNRSVNDMLSARYEDIAMNVPTRPRLTITNLRTVALNHVESVDDPVYKADIKQSLYRGHRNNDRHSNLSVHTRHDTWEFRLWNSTRSAWRMELFCWLSLAFENNQFIRVLAETPVSDYHSEDPTPIREGLRAAGMDEALDLFDRQISYLTRLDRGDIAYVDDLVAL